MLWEDLGRRQLRNVEGSVSWLVLPMEPSQAAEKEKVKRPAWGRLWVSSTCVQCFLCLAAHWQEGQPEAGAWNVAVPSVSPTATPASSPKANHQGRESPDHAQAEAFPSLQLWPTEKNLFFIPISKHQSHKTILTLLIVRFCDNFLFQSIKRKCQNASGDVLNWYHGSWVGCVIWNISF